MNIFLTVTSFHILASMKANEASTSWKENLLFPPTPSMDSAIIKRRNSAEKCEAVFLH